jgi:hypothetical protein
MATVRPEVSKKSKYWIERHRYHELKHFCLQYPVWRQSYFAVDSLARRPIEAAAKTNKVSDPVAERAEVLGYYSDRMAMVEAAALASDAGLAGYILKGVTEGLSFDALRVQTDIPCCKDVYYEAYRRFFWVLSKTRQ